MNIPQFGGSWTERKLEALEKYLCAYLTIFTENPKAKKFTRHYVDAFAGSGLRSIRNTNPLFNFEAEETFEFMDGSVRKVLSMSKLFHKYLFVEKDSNHAASLEQMVKKDFPEKFAQCEIIKRDANEVLIKWADRLSTMDRAIVFLDPYGMDVQWAMIEKLASTKKVDLWMLFPSASVIRMLPKKGPPEEAWSQCLTRLFGNEEWSEEFYPQKSQEDLFGESIVTERNVTEETVSNYLLRRLKKIFSEVADKPLTLRNSRNSPLFMLVFAAGNPSGAELAIKIASDIIENT